MLIAHIERMRNNVMWRKSVITILVEHNLGFEAEHHERALRGLKNVSFYKDCKRQRVGILTTLQVKHAMCTLTNAMLREERVSLLSDEAGFVSTDGKAMKKLLLDELETYSYQFKVGAAPTMQIFNPYLDLIEVITNNCFPHLSLRLLFSARTSVR
jgi:hypothetical protein